MLSSYFDKYHLDFGLGNEPHSCHASCGLIDTLCRQQTEIAPDPPGARLDRPANESDSEVNL
jgi:hypothetical protein